MAHAAKQETSEDALFFNVKTPAAGLPICASVRRFKAGETIYVESDDARYCYQLISGVAKEFNTLEDGRRQVADFYNTGDLFGLSETRAQLHTAEAITDCTLRCYPRDTFMQTIAASPELSKFFLDTLMSRLHRARERMIMIGRMTAIERVVSFLLRLKEDQNGAREITIAMSRQDIADHLGLTIETVCRTLTELKKQGVIAMPSARLFSIIDAAQMDDLTGSGDAAIH